MKEGRIESQGTYRDLVAGGLDLEALIGKEERNAGDDGGDNDIGDDVDDDKGTNVGNGIYGAPKEGRRPSCAEVRPLCLGRTLHHYRFHSHHHQLCCHCRNGRCC